MTANQQAFLLLSGGNAVFYRPVAITTEIRAGYLFKSPPPKRLKTEVTEFAQSVQHIFSGVCFCFMIYFHGASPAEIMEEALFCSVQNQ